VCGITTVSRTSPASTLVTERAFVQANRDDHLDRTTASGVEDSVTRNGHRVGEIAVDLVQDVLKWSVEEDCAFGQEGEISAK
jgi:hypothetical protein